MFLLTVAVVFHCLHSKPVPVLSTLSKLIADPSLPDKLFCSDDLIKQFPRDIYFDGDSTIRLLYEQLIKVMEGKMCYSALMPKGFTASGNRPTPTTIYTQNFVYKKVWAKDFPHDIRKMRKFLFERLNNIKQKIIIWNQGLHLLHLYPARRFENLFFTLNFKSVMTLVMESISQSAQCVIFVTTNPIATSKFTGSYQEYAKQLDEKNQALIRRCVERYQNQEACENAVFTDKGVRWLNEKMHQFVDEYDSEQGPKLVLMDAYSLFVNKSYYTDIRDGRHYGPIKNLEVALLKETIEKKC